MQVSGIEQLRLARDSYGYLHYGYLHLPMVAGIVLFALGLRTTLGDVDATLNTVPAVGLCVGAALYLLGHVAFLFRATGRIFRRTAIGVGSYWRSSPPRTWFPHSGRSPS
jgi:low temperature requirement protein LtrA